MCASAAFAVLYNVSAELFPTVVRNVGTGMGSLFARAGGLSAPTIHLLVTSPPPPLITVVSTLAILTTPRKCTSIVARPNRLLGTDIRLRIIPFHSWSFRLVATRNQTSRNARNY